MKAKWDTSMQPLEWLKLKSLTILIYLHHWWECTMAITSRTLWQSLKKFKHKYTIWPSHSIVSYYPNKNKSIYLYRDLYANVYSSFSCSQNLETTQMSANRWISKEIVLYLFNKILLINKNELTIDVCYNMGWNSKYSG